MRPVILLVIGLLLVGCTGGGETVVSGIGNSGNRIRTDAVVDDIAEALSEHPAVPEVEVEDILQAFESIRAHAREGDLQATLVLLELAARQSE